ncbi:unnamed protein product, partial [Prunus brigantina]
GAKLLTQKNGSALSRATYLYFSFDLVRCARCLEFRCGTVAINCGTAT